MCNKAIPAFLLLLQWDTASFFLWVWKCTININFLQNQKFFCKIFSAPKLCVSFSSTTFVPDDIRSDLYLASYIWNARKMTCRSTCKVFVKMIGFWCQLKYLDTSQPFSKFRGCRVVTCGHTEWGTERFNKVFHRGTNSPKNEMMNKVSTFRRNRGEVNVSSSFKNFYVTKGFSN
jgi:hypothetical protein